MSDAKTIWQQGSMSATVDKVPPPELIEHIEATYLGTPGGLQYHHTTGIEKLKGMQNCYFLFMKRSGRMIGSIGYVLRNTKVGDQVVKSWLIRYFSVKAPMRSAQKSKKLTRKRPIADRTNSLLKDVTHIIHDNPERLIDIDVKEVPKAVIYGLIEKDNERSRNFAEIGGYSKTGEVESFMFSRLWIRRNIAVEQLSEKEVPAMKKRLESFYYGYAFYFDDYLFLNKNYYVLRDGGEIIAGLQANEEAWEIRTIGNGFLDRIVKVLTRIPLIGKRFRYEEMRFLGIEGMYFAPGYEKALYRLLEGVLAAKKQYLALMIMDPRSPEYQVFAKNRRLGPVHKVLGSFNGDIYMKFFNFPEDEKREIISRPVYISIYDNT